MFDELEDFLNQFFSNHTGKIDFSDPDISGVPGEWTSSSGEDEHGSYELRRFKSDDGKIEFTSFSRSSGPEDIQPGDGFEVSINEEIARLETEEANAVINDDFEIAISKRDKIKELEAMLLHDTELKALYEKKSQAINKRDYETAQQVQTEIEEFLANIRDISNPETNGETDTDEDIDNSTESE